MKKLSLTQISKKPLLSVTFYDHSTGDRPSDKPFLCVAYGRKVHETKRYIKLAYWIPLVGDKDVIYDNMELHTIMKDCIVSTRVLLVSQ